MPSRTSIIVLSSVSFFMRFAAFGAFAPYISLWLKHSDHTTAVIGGLYSLYRFVNFCSPMVIGALADSYKCHRSLLIGLTFLNGLAVAGLTLYPQSVSWQAAGLIVIAGTDSASLVDALIVRCLAWADAEAMAPRCRAFGALAWCAVAPLYGAAASEYGIATLFMAYAPLLWIALPFCAALPATRAYAEARKPPAAALPDDTGTKAANVAAAADATAGAAAAGGDAAAAETASTSTAERAERAECAGRRADRRFRARLGVLARSRRALCLLLLIFLVGMHFGIAFGFGFPYLEGELGASGLQIGLTLTAQALLEVPLFQVAGRLAHTLGLRTALLTCMLAATFRFSGWVAVTSAWWVLPFEVGHGWSFALYYTCAALLAEEFTASGLQATVLGCSSSALQAGSLVATLLWTLLITELGMRTAFLLAALLFAVASLPLLSEVPRVCRALNSVLNPRGARRAWRSLLRCCCCCCNASGSRGRLLAAGTLSSSSSAALPSEGGERAARVPAGAAAELSEGPAPT